MTTILQVLHNTNIVQPTETEIFHTTDVGVEILEDEVPRILAREARVHPPRNILTLQIADLYLEADKNLLAEPLHMETCPAGTTRDGVYLPNKSNGGLVAMRPCRVPNDMPIMGFFGLPAVRPYVMQMAPHTDEQTINLDEFTLVID